jgi:hypothetical protein
MIIVKCDIVFHRGYVFASSNYQSLPASADSATKPLGNYNMHRPIVPTGLRRFVQRVFRGGDEEVVSPVAASAGKSSSSQASYAAATTSERPSAEIVAGNAPSKSVVQGRHDSDPPRLSREVDAQAAMSETPMNKALQSKLQNLEEAEAMEGDRANTLKHDVGKARHGVPGKQENDTIHHSREVAAQDSVPVTPMNKALQTKLQSLEEAQAQEDERTNALRNDVFRKQRHAYGHSPASAQPVASAAGRRHKNKGSANADVIVTDDVFVINNMLRGSDEDMGSSAPSVPFERTPHKPESINHVTISEEPPQVGARSRVRSESSAGTVPATATASATRRPSTEVQVPKTPSAHSTHVPLDSKARRPSTDVHGSMTPSTQQTHSQPEDRAEKVPVAADISADGSGGHKQSVTHATPAAKPAVVKLPEGWEQVHTDDGAVYYYHKVTRVSRYSARKYHYFGRLINCVRLLQVGFSR